MKKKRYEVDERIEYKDHLSEIVHQAEKDGHFDDLPGKGKPLNLGRQASDPYEAQLYKTMKDNHVLPRWIELGNEIDQFKETISTYTDKKKKRKAIKEINKKIKEYNYICPPSLQKMKVSLDNV